MKLSKVQTSPDFKGALSNKYFLKCLEGISNHPATFVASTTFLMSGIVRPFAISLTPKTDKENKKFAIADSISSSVIKFLIAETIALPVENTIKKMDKNPAEFLNKKTIKNLKQGADSLLESKNYKFASQIVKLGTNLISAIPKSIIAVALIPPIMNGLFKEKKKNNDISLIKKDNNPIFSSFYDKTSFKGLEKPVQKAVSKIFNNDSFQNFVNKYSPNEANIARNMNVLTDLTLAGTYIFRTKTSKKIKENKKDLLISNKLISTVLSVVLGLKIDDIVKKGSINFIENFKKQNIMNPKLDKYIQGINVLRPTLIFALLYYAILPLISTFVSDKIDKFQNKNDTKN